jgi:hypothetical protein
MKQRKQRRDQGRFSATNGGEDVEGAYETAKHMGAFVFGRVHFARTIGLIHRITQAKH